MNLQNILQRVERLERIRGVDKPPVILCVHLIKGDGTEDPRTEAEEAALEREKERLLREAEGTPSVPFIVWAAEKARELLAQEAGQEPSDEGEG